MTVIDSPGIAPISAPVAVADFQRQVHCVLGLPFDALDNEQAEQALLDRAQARRRCFFSTPNLNFLIASLSDTAFRDSVLRSDLSFADGMPIIWIARLLGVPIRHRVAGSTLFERLRAQRAVPLRVFFFGGPDGVARRAGDVLNADRGPMVCVGAHAPGFGTLADMSRPELIAEINAARADLLVVALGAKRGQAWIEHNLPALKVPLVSHLGAVVNFVAGTVSRAPSRLGGLGLEWLWRIKEEPTLWRRYWSDGLALLRLFATRVLPSALGRGHGGGAPVLNATDDGQRHHLALSGSWRAADLAPLRQALSAATAAPRHISLDLSGVGTLDSAALGLLLLLYGHQSRTGAGLSVGTVAAPLRRRLRLQCADYLLQGLAPAAPR